MPPPIGIVKQSGHGKVKTAGFCTSGLDSQRRLLLLVSVHSESLLSLVSCYLMLLSFSSARHSNAPSFPYGINVITGLFCFFTLQMSSSMRAADHLFLEQVQKE